MVMGMTSLIETPIGVALRRKREKEKMGEKRSTYLIFNIVVIDYDIIIL